MRGLLLLLPVILVIIILAGSGQAEEEVAEQLVEGLALEEKAEVALERDAREAGKKKGDNNNQEENKTKLKKRQKRLKKRKGGKKSKKAMKNKSNKEKSAKKKGKKSKKGLKTKSKKQGAKRKGGKSKKKRNKNSNKHVKKNKKKLSNKQKRQKKKAGNRKKNARGSTKKKKKVSNKNKDKKKKKPSQAKPSNIKKTPGKVKKTKRKRKGSKKSDQKSTRNGRQGPPVWSDWSSCGKSGVNDSCILNAVAALNFEKNQIQTFLKQKARLLNQNKTTGKKLGKKGEFTDAAGYLLIALGGNISAPACGERESSNASKTTSTRALTAAMDTYATLMNCSAIIKEGCSMPDKHINQTFLDECEIVYKKSKNFSEDCRGNKTYTADGSLACLCWEKAAYGIVVAKEKGCTTASTQSAKAVKKQKTACLKAFSICKKAEDAAIALVHTCMAGEINTVAAKGEGRWLG